jgi:predicted ATPase
LDHLSHRLTIITGGPGAGKSSLIAALHARGYATMPESGRAIIQDQIAIGGRALPWIDPGLYAELMLAADRRSYHAAEQMIADQNVPRVFFDRGIPDVVGYLELCSLPIPSLLHEAAQQFRYHRLVFLAPPWREIFRQDEERKQDFSEAVRTCEAMIETYSRYGYTLIEIPLSTVDERVEFILREIQS